MKASPPFTDETLREIITRSALYLSIFNSALSLGPNSPWSQVLRQRKSMALVCKRWNALATPLLYREVVLRRTKQLMSLEETLSNSTNGIHVHELTITEACWITADGYESSMCYQASAPEFPDGYEIDSDDLSEEDREQMVRFLNEGRILGMLPHKCPNLRRLNLRTLVPDEIPRSIIANPALLNITCFSFGGSVDDVESGYPAGRPWFYPAAGSIHSLSVPILSDFTHIPRYMRTRGDPPQGAPPQKIIFPELEELTVFKSIQKFPEHWALPRLKSLTLCSDEFGPSFLDDLCSFLRKNGRNLRHLAVYCKGRSLGMLPAHILLRECPNVEHFICDGLPATPEGGARAKVFPKVTILDVYSLDEPWEEAKLHFYKRVACFPSLKLVRFFEDPRSFENYFRPPVSFGIDPIDVFEEACLWIAPYVRLNRHVVKPQNFTNGINVIIASLPLVGAQNRGQRQPGSNGDRSSGEFESDNDSDASVSDHDSNSDSDTGPYSPSSSSSGSETGGISDEDAGERSDKDWYDADESEDVEESEFSGSSREESLQSPLRSSRDSEDIDD